MQVRVVDVQRQPHVRFKNQAVSAVLHAVVLALAAVAAEEVPPEAAAHLALEGRETEAGAVAMEAEGLGDADGEALEDPEALAAVLDTEDGLVQ